MNKESILKRFLYFLLAFLVLCIEQTPTIFVRVKDVRAVSLLILVMLLISAGALFLGKRLGLLEGFRALSSMKAWGNDWPDLPRYLHCHWAWCNGHDVGRC